MKIISHFVAFVFILGASACSAPIQKPDVVPTQLPPEPTLTAVVVENTTVAPPPTAEPAMPAVAELTETDACKLYTPEEVNQLLGETVAPRAVDSPGYSFCTFFTPAGKTLLISITTGDQAKKNFLNEIGQFQKGCEVSYSGSTRAATPFPPEIEAMMGKSVLELYALDLELQTKCGGKVKPLPEFGPNANLVPNMMGIGSVAIVSGENYYTFSYEDSNININQMEEKAKEIVRSALSQ